MSDNKIIHAYIDGDLIQYRFSIANQNKEGTTDFERAKKQVADYLSKIEDRVFAEKMTIVFSERKNYRKTLNRCYKSNRQGDKPILFNLVREFMKNNYVCISENYIEADDLLGIICTREYENEIPVLVSYDKDMRTLPVTIYNPQTDEFEKMTPEAAETVFWTQCVTGDTTDGYYGIPGVGPKGAVAIVEEIMAKESFDEKLNVLLREYAWRYLDTEYALRQCQMAYILRNGDFDFEKKLVKLFGTDDWYDPMEADRPVATQEMF